MVLLYYWIPQFIGGFLGFLIPKFLIDDFFTSNYGVPLLPYKDSSGDYHDMSAFVVEIWATFIFTTVFLVVTHPSTHHTSIGAINGILVCTGLWVARNSAAKASGGGLNPALGLA